MISREAVQAGRIAAGRNPVKLVAKLTVRVGFCPLNKPGRWLYFRGLVDGLNEPARPTSMEGVRLPLLAGKLPQLALPLPLLHASQGLLL
jgi:hypothetical protein